MGRTTYFIFPSNHHRKESRAHLVHKEGVLSKLFKRWLPIFLLQAGTLLLVDMRTEWVQGGQYWNLKKATTFILLFIAWCGQTPTQIELEGVPGSFHDYTRLQSKETLMYHILLLEQMVWVLVPNGCGKSLVILLKIFQPIPPPAHSVCCMQGAWKLSGNCIWKTTVETK